MEKLKKEDTWKKIQNDTFFTRSNGVKKRARYPELECKTGVKHNSKFKKIHFQKIKSNLLEKKEVNKRNRENKNKWTFQYEGFFWFT